MEPTPSVVVLGDTLAILSSAVIHSPRHPRLEDVGRASLHQSVQSEVAALGLAPGDTVNSHSDKTTYLSNNVQV